MALLATERLHALLDRARRGDAEAWDELVLIFRPGLIDLARVRLDYRLRGRFDPEDLVQDAFTDVLTSLGDFFRDQGRVSFKIWLRQRLRSRLRRAYRDHLQNQIRSVLREITVPFKPTDSRPDPAAGFIAPGSSPSHNLTRLEAVRLVQDALGELPEVDRRILLLYSVERLSFKEIADLLGIDSAKARKRYHQASCQLGRSLRRTHSDWSDAAYPRPQETA